MTALDPLAPEEVRFRRDFLVWTLAAGAVATAIALTFPELDLSIATAVRTACPAVPDSKDWCTFSPIPVVRSTFMVLFVVIAVAVVVATARSVIIGRQWLGVGQLRCWFMVAALIVGPGVVANLVLKDNFGRARPRDVVELGGNKSFSPVLVPSRECPRNCSFVSGEASSMYASFFALALVVPQLRIALVAGGIVAGTLAGGVRILQGAHFLGDVLFAEILMAVTVSLLHVVMIGIWRDPRNALGATLIATFGLRPATSEVR